MGIRIATTVRALAIALALVVGAEAGRIAIGSNFHSVVTGRCYRCAQPSAEDLDVIVKSLGIRSIVNLRGSEDQPWYTAERHAAERLGVRLTDAGIWAQHPATEQEFLAVFHAVDESPEPVLIHCQSGIDRSGMASALFLLLKTDATVEQARGQLSPRFGHNPWGRAACQDRVLGAYVEWLGAQGFGHTPERLRQWAHRDYHPALED
jgi:protein tyrosine/serine phosphatase